MFWVSPSSPRRDWLLSIPSEPLLEKENFNVRKAARCWVGGSGHGKKKEQEHNPNDQEEMAGDSRKFKTCLKKNKVASRSILRVCADTGFPGPQPFLNIVPGW